MWLAAWWGQAGAPVWAIGIVGVAVALTRAKWAVVAMVCVLCLSAWWSGHISSVRQDRVLGHETAPGAIDSGLRLLEDPVPGAFGWWAVGVFDPPRPPRPPQIPLLVTFDGRPDAVAGERLDVRGRLVSRTGRAAGRHYSGALSVIRWEPGEGEVAPWWWAGNAVRRRALDRLHGRGAAFGLLAGFLVGDVTQVPQPDLEAMRRTGLTHLVAVSGSNVALFLTLAMMAAGPLAAGPRRRAVLGLLAIVVFVVATRWEPSVIRASVMAALILAGRVGGWVLDTLTALGVTVTMVILVSAELVTDIGFILSVLATLGVTLGGRLVANSTPLAKALGVTLGAQLAVSPVLLLGFGSIPLLAPVANLVAVPVVALATSLAVVGVATGLGPVLDLASMGAEIVLFVARLGSEWPQVGWTAVMAFILVGGLAMMRRLRPWVVIVAGAAVMVILVDPSPGVEGPALVVLDVGQGDSILAISGTGQSVLVDGGPDPGVLEEKLSEYGVRRIDLIVLSHVHSDHAAGLEAAIGRRPVGRIWLPGPPHETQASKRVVELAQIHGIPAGPPPVGRSVELGDLRIEVLGPVRRYDSPNDQSIVLRVGVEGGPRVLLTGDIETFAQSDLGAVAADILKVPHQGGATSDLDWLASIGARQSVISVGPNDFGHPSEEVIGALLASGSEVRRTDLEGDIVIGLHPQG